MKTEIQESIRNFPVNWVCLPIGFMLSICVQLLLLQCAGKALWPLQWYDFEQHACFKFCLEFIRSATETIKMLYQAFGKHGWGWTQFKNKHFQADQIAV